MTASHPPGEDRVFEGIKAPLRATQALRQACGGAAVWQAQCRELTPWEHSRVGLNRDCDPWDAEGGERTGVKEDPACFLPWGLPRGGAVDWDVRDGFGGQGAGQGGECDFQLPEFEVPLGYGHRCDWREVEYMYVYGGGNVKQRNRYLVIEKIRQNKECKGSQREACLYLMIILLRATKSASQPLPLEKNILE